MGLESRNAGCNAGYIKSNTRSVAALRWDGNVRPGRSPDLDIRISIGAVDASVLRRATSSNRATEGCCSFWVVYFCTLSDKLWHRTLPYGRWSWPHCVRFLGCIVQSYGGQDMQSVIPRFRRDVDEICPLLGYYAASSANPLPTFRDSVSVPFSSFKKTTGIMQRRVVILYRRFGTVYRSLFQVSKRPRALCSVEW
jgi:hypothetical protein